MKPKNRVFQFSSINNEELVSKMKEIIHNLGGFFEDSTIYSSKSTHLIVDKIDSTEKIFCFISAGKWILSKKYLTDCSAENKFLDEPDYNISFEFSRSKIASASRRWKDIIEKNQTYPFTDWNVACMIGNKNVLEAIIRIVTAGKGKASYPEIVTTTRVTRRSSIQANNMKKNLDNVYTIVVYDDEMKNEAFKYTNSLDVPCYPYQSITDYIMQASYSNKPLLSTEYYNKFFEEKQTFVQSQNKQPIESDPIIYELSFENYIKISNYKKRKLEFVDSSIQHHVFDILWKNNAFHDSISFLSLMQSNDLIDESNMTSLFDFLMHGVKKSEQSFVCIENANSTYNYTYDLIYSYILNSILSHPPESKKLMDYYIQVFEESLITFKLTCADITIRPSEVKGYIDVIYLITVHDKILININKDNYPSCASILLKLNQDDSKTKIINTLAKQTNNISLQTNIKMLEILQFCNKEFGESKYYEKAKNFLSSFKESNNSFAKLFAYLRA